MRFMSSTITTHGTRHPVPLEYALPGLERHRAGVKKVFNAFLYSDKPLSRLPRGTRALVPKHISFRDIEQRLLERHEPIAQLFCRGVGMEVMFIESEIMVDVLLSLRDQGIVALPVHDAVLVPRSKVSETRDTMLRAFIKHTGAEGQVEVNTPTP